MSEIISEEFLRILRCPIGRSPLALADERLIARVNEGIGRQRILNRTGQTVERRLDGGLLNQERTLLYPIHDGIPCLLADEAIALEQLDNGGEYDHERENDFQEDH